MSGGSTLLHSLDHFMSSLLVYLAPNFVFHARNVTDPLSVATEATAVLVCLMCFANSSLFI